ncbi:hypothetical protein T265_11651 [Opisthorchis viverrini]|uniref:Uncharacterized protein n=1 Tax=Opisthorchis viverrini TaxID=6198 RepID=A0A074ZWS9_OPIVI|nr:hypothetical protein T265_11651 [Opisthorchis viverrini]KER19624.1 hypothetical protein T265_11651 [Opisthorchis viverrini]
MLNAKPRVEGHTSVNHIYTTVWIDAFMCDDERLDLGVVYGAQPPEPILDRGIRKPRNWLMFKDDPD